MILLLQMKTKPLWRSLLILKGINIGTRNFASLYDCLGVAGRIDLSLVYVH